MAYSGFECPTCKADTKRLITSPSLPGVYCPNCYQNPGYADPTKTAKHWGVHDTLHADGSTKISRGKAWEIDNRINDPESGRVINRFTGKPAQY